MKVKVSEASRHVLDWMVAKCEFPGWDSPRSDALTAGYDGIGIYHEAYSPSTDWAQGGPIVEREIDKYQRIPKDTEQGFVFVAGTYSGHMGSGPTPLIAAMRCYVASKLGDEVEVPDDLA